MPAEPASRVLWPLPGLPTSGRGAPGPGSSGQTPLSRGSPGQGPVLGTGSVLGGGSWHLPGRSGGQETPHPSPTHRAVLQHLLQGGQVARGAPALGNEALVRGAHAALVEDQVHGLHLVDLHPPGRQQPLHPAQHLAQEALRLPQDLRPEQAVREAAGPTGRGRQGIGAARAPTSCSSWLCCCSCCRVPRRPSSCSTNGKTWQWKLAGRRGGVRGAAWAGGALAGQRLSRKGASGAGRGTGQ